MRTPRSAARANELYQSALDRAQRPPLGEVKASQRALVAITTACLRQAARQNRGKPALPFPSRDPVQLPPVSGRAQLRRGVGR